MGRLPVGGIGAIAGAANSVASEVARSVADDVSRRGNDGRSGPSAGGGWDGDDGMVTRWFDSSGGGDHATVQRAPTQQGQSVQGQSGQGQSGRSSARGSSQGQSDDSQAQERRQQEAWLKFAASDAFRDQILEMLQERLLGELERRGGRHGGWFA